MVCAFAKIFLHVAYQDPSSPDFANAKLFISTTSLSQEEDERRELNPFA